MTKRKRHVSAHIVILVLAWLVTLIAMVRTGNVAQAVVYGLSTYLGLCAIYIIVGRLAGFPRMRVEDFFAGIIAMLP